MGFIKLSRKATDIAYYYISYPPINGTQQRAYELFLSPLFTQLELQ